MRIVCWFLVFRLDLFIRPERIKGLGGMPSFMVCDGYIWDIKCNLITYFINET